MLLVELIMLITFLVQQLGFAQLHKRNNIFKKKAIRIPYSILVLQHLNELNKLVIDIKLVIMMQIMQKRLQNQFHVMHQ
jgi:hypothetical protein